jgi:hypothetical protein
MLVHHVRALAAWVCACIAGVTGEGRGRGLCGRTGAAKGTSLSNGAEGAPAVFLRPGTTGGGVVDVSGSPLHQSASRRLNTGASMEKSDGSVSRCDTSANILDAGTMGVSVKGFLILALSWLSDVAVKCVNPSRAARLHKNGRCETGRLRGEFAAGNTAVGSSRVSRGKK